MSEVWAILYGIIQGITEFLPVSSSGHLALLPHFFTFEDLGVIFDLCMHLGTTLAVIVYFFQDIRKLLVNPITLIKERNNFYVMNFIITTISSVIVILLIKGLAFEFGRSSKFIAFNLIFFGVLMIISDRLGTDHHNPFKKSHMIISALIGVAQSIAVFPGVSRSGATVTAARLFHIGRVEASRFSFLMSLPIILASISYKTPQILSG